MRRSEPSSSSRSPSSSELPFFPEGDDSLLERLGELHLFSRGRSKKIRNMLHGETRNLELAIFDYRYTIGHGKNSRTHRQSVIYFGAAALALPPFELRPEGVFHRVGSAFGYQDIDFETHAQFSRTYLLRGDTEEGVRGLFSDELLEFFETHPGLSVEGGGNQLVFYRRKKRIEPDGTQEFMEEGTEVLTLFGGPT